MSEWKEYKLKDITTDIGDGIHGTPKYSENGEYYFINGNNISKGKVIIKGDTKKVCQTEFEKYKKTLSDRTILLSINGTIGNVGFYNNEKCILGKSACYLNLKDNVDKHFVYYTFLTDDFQSHLLNIATGTTIQNVPLKGLRESIILLPSLDEQKRIASILSSLDDKIDLLNRENATLEAMAETLFRQWFIEETPEDWEEIPFGKAIEIFDYKRIPLSKMERDKMKDSTPLYPYYGAAEIMDYINSYLFDGEYILMGEDGTVKTDDGYPILQYTTGKFWPNNHTHVIQAKYPYNNCFIWNYLKTTNIENIVTGAVQPKINQANMLSLPFYNYPVSIIEKYQTITQPWWDKIIKNKEQITSLTEQRDILLPKLMSNEIVILRL